MIRNIFFMMLGGLLTTFVLTVIALCQAAGEADRMEEEMWWIEETQNKAEEEDIIQERAENGMKGSEDK